MSSSQSNTRTRSSSSVILSDEPSPGVGINDSISSEVDVWTSSHRSFGVLELKNESEKMNDSLQDGILAEFSITPRQQDSLQCCHFQGCFQKLVFSIFACIIGSSFQYGYHIGVLNLPEKVLLEFYNDTLYSREKQYLSGNMKPFLWGLTVSIYCIGGMIGGYISSYFIRNFGRKTTLLWNNLPTIVALTLMCFSKLAHSFEMIIIGRFIVGISAGISTSVAPMYLNEIAPVHLRGFISTINQSAILLGVIMAQIVGLHSVWGKEEIWPLIFGLSVFPLIIQMLTLPWCPESPAYLINRDEDEAEAALVWLRGTHDVGYELEELRTTKEEARHKPQVTYIDLFRIPYLRKPLLICVMMMLSQQLSGINAVVFYSTRIFQSVNLSAKVAQIASILTMVLNLMVNFVSAFLVDRLGRKILHLAGLSGMFFASIFIVVASVFREKYSWMSYLTVACVCFYIIFFSIGPGSIPWFIGAELFLTGAREYAMSLAVVANWLANFAVGICFPFMDVYLHSYSFLIFTGLLLLFIVYTFLKVPETKGRKIEDIVADFQSEDTQERVLI
ncbi:solute carrier family 2, facilitated glucose transporter member 1 isoform X1 [Octopus sinensis]|uniref:Solute carrier family 2, facilitated glucose transporter member 1 isoform X1 n=1 Tax=Octopus sinensis TaxID=2607531 RepID=A0A6P7TNZ8_9MOLL|nr:solute carrier family 2, facilitated glucose transporter member 1 isoform X1 [Octopus sinensis]